MSETARAHLLEAYWSVYTTLGPDRITVKAVVARAGYHRSTFYEHFTGLGDCLRAIEELCLPTLDDLPPVELDGDPIGALGNADLSLLGPKGRYYSVLLGEGGDPAFRRRFIEAVKALVTQPGAPGRARLPTDPRERDLVLEYRITGLLGLLAHVPRG